MASLQDVTVPVGSWLNVHTTRGISIGAQIFVQNKTSTQILLFVSQSTPPDSSGMVIAGNDFNLLQITPGTNEVLWCRSNATTTGVLGVQE